MNRYIKYICFGVMCMGLTSCDDWFDGILDDQLPKHDLVPENAIVDEKSSEKALLGAYSYMDDSKYNSGYLNSQLIIRNWIRLNLMAPVGGGSFESDQLYKFNYDETDSNFELPWTHVYKIINAANNTIYYTELADDNNYGPNRKNELLAEARFLRGFCHMYLMQHYSQFYDMNSEYGVLLRTEPSKLSNNNLARASVKDSYEAIFSDLEFAAENAPAFSSIYRISKTAAKAFYANYLLMRGTEADYEKALTLADEVLASTEFSMEENYADIFTKRYSSSELMFTQYTEEPYVYTANVRGLAQTLGRGQYRAKEYDPEDEMSLYYEIMNDEESARYVATVDSITFPGQTSQNKVKTFVWKKFHTLEKEAIPMYYMRVAQMYLVKAEAKSYKGYSIGDVLDELNVLRERAGETPLVASDYADMEAVRAEIMREYVREFGAENADPYFYAARTFVDGHRLLADYNVNYSDEKTLCFPIPAKELEKNNLAKQNPY